MSYGLKYVFIIFFVSIIVDNVLTLNFGLPQKESSLILHGFYRLTGFWPHAVLTNTAFQITSAIFPYFLAFTAGLRKTVKASLSLLSVAHVLGGFAWITPEFITFTAHFMQALGFGVLIVFGTFEFYVLRGKEVAPRNPLL